VLVTPPESDELHCLDLRTGKLLWKQPRGEMNRLACVSDDVLLLVGKQKLTALRLEDGKPAWADRSLELPRGAEPAGNGFLTGGRYIFPLASAEVVAVDVATGQIAARVGARDGAPLGNLICHRGAIISQNGLSLDCFDQVDDLLKRSERQLADNPDSVDALRALGEIAYNEGRLSEAIDLEERAYRQAPDDPDVREILAECLADALDGDFAAYRSRLPLLKELESDGAVTRSHVLRLESQGLLAAGDPMGSLRACLAMARAADDAGELLTLRRDHRTHTARWVQAQVAAIWDAADEDQRTVLIDRAQKEAAALGDNPSGEDIEHFLKFFGALPAFDDLKLVRARQLDTEGRTLESQQLLLDLTHSSDEAIQREAVARIAAQLHAAGLHGLAGEYDDQLAGALADAPCLDGVTGRDLTARWAESTADANLSWPTGQVEVRGAPATAAGVRSRGPVWSMRLEHADSILGSGVGFLAMRGSELTWHDGLGRRVFAAAFDDQSQTMYRQPGSVYASARGNLLVVSSGRELAAFNTLAKRDAEAPSLVWRASLASNFDVDTMFMGADSLAAERRPGSFRPRRTPYENKWLGVIGPITSSGCYFQDQRRLVCVNPITGEEQWSRSDVPPGCDLFGDSRYVFATPVGSQVAQVFNALDGRSLGEVRVPSWEEQVTTRGRKVIRWNRSPQGELTLSEVDPLAKGVNWQHTFAVGARIDIDRDRYVAVVEPKGRAAIVDLETGALLVDHAQLFTPQPRLDEIHLSAASDHFVLVVEQPAAPDTGRNLRALNSNDSPVVDGQLVVLNRTDGTSRWARPASVLRQALVLNQPAELPFVMFAGTLVSSTRGEGEGRNSTSLLLIDKATGRTLYSSDELPQIGVGYLTAELTDADKREVTIDMAGRPLVVQFTNARRPPQPPAMAEVESATSKSSEGIYGIFRSLGGGG
jgi:outer membrane protein assembly factor BamB